MKSRNAVENKTIQVEADKKRCREYKAVMKIEKLLGGVLASENKLHFLYCDIDKAFATVNCLVLSQAVANTEFEQPPAPVISLINDEDEEGVGDDDAMRA